MPATTRGNVLGHAFDVIEYLGGQKFPFTKAELAEELDVTDRSALRYLDLAEARGWVSREFVGPCRLNRFRSLIYVGDRVEPRLELPSLG